MMSSRQGTLRNAVGLILLCFAIGLGGCADPNTDYGQTQQEGTMTGAGAGALIGALIGQLAGGDTESTLVGAAAGAAIGGLAGYSYGTHVADQKKEYASKEDWLDACLASARTKNQKAAQYNQVLREDIGQISARIAAVKSSNISHSNKARNLASAKSALQKDQAAVQQAIADIQHEIQEQSKVMQSASGSYAVALQNELNQLRRELAELEQNQDALASLSEKMAV